MIKGLKSGQPSSLGAMTRSAAAGCASAAEARAGSSPEGETNCNSTFASGSDSGVGVLVSPGCPATVAVSSLTVAVGVLVWLDCSTAVAGSPSGVGVGVDGIRKEKTRAPSGSILSGLLRWCTGESFLSRFGLTSWVRRTRPAAGCLKAGLGLRHRDAGTGLMGAPAGWVVLGRVALPRGVGKLEIRPKSTTKDPGSSTNEARQGRT